MDYSELPIVEHNDVIYARDYNQTEGLPRAMWDKLIAETSFSVIEPLPQAATYDQAEAIGLRTIECPWCHRPTTETRTDRRKILLATQGDATGVQVRRSYPCRCLFYDKLFTRWSGPDAMVPQGYRKFRLPSLAPNGLSRLSLEDQAAVIIALKGNPTQNYLFVGPEGTGKTSFSTALFWDALWDWANDAWSKQTTVEAVWMIKAKDYLEQEYQYLTKRDLKTTDVDGNESLTVAQEPLVTERKIKDAARHGFTPRLFLEEIDKIPDLTKFRSSNLFSLISEVNDREGQIVISSNLNEADLTELLGLNGGPLVRRFLNDRVAGKAEIFDFYTYKTQGHR